MCSTDVYRVYRVEVEEPEKAEDKCSVEFICAEARLLDAVVSLVK